MELRVWTISYFKQSLFNTDLEHSLLHLYFAFEEFLGFVFQKVPSTAFARLVLLSPYFDKPVSVRYQESQLITAEAMFAEVQKVVQSHDNFVIDQGLRLHVFLCIPPAGTGKHKRGCKYADVDLRKRSCKQVYMDSTDYLCLSKALVIGRAVALHPDSNDLVRKYHLRNQPAVTLLEQQKQLHAEAGIPIEQRLYSLTDVEKFQFSMKDHFQLFVFERTDKLRCIFVGSTVPKTTPIFLLMKNNHFHLITNIDKFLPQKTYFCVPCATIFTSATRYKHLECKRLCQSCEFPDCNAMSEHFLEKD